MQSLRCLSRLGCGLRQALLSNGLRRPLAGLRQAQSQAQPQAQWHPLVSHLTRGQRRAIGAWLATCAGMTAGAVVLGGVTRLTRSGLSMTDWNLLKEKPPMSEEEWQREFERYKQFPEYEHVVSEQGEMSLQQFKFIYWFEFVHRQWGRLIGLAFLAPAAYFWSRGRFQPGMQKRVGIFGALLLGQGLLGWYMVKSGLSKETLTQDVPRVSQYRLAAHLSSALLLFALLTWSSLTHLRPLESLGEFAKGAKRLRGPVHLAVAMVFLTACSGAFVAGIDAGLVYNSWPKMADRWVPTDLWALQPAWRNAFENATTTQFNHRLLGHTTAAVMAGLWLWGRRLNLSPKARLALNCALGVVLVQVSLGVTTLLTYVHTHVAATHQAGSVALLGTAIWLMHELRRLPK